MPLPRHILYLPGRLLLLLALVSGWAACLQAQPLDTFVATANTQAVAGNYIAAQNTVNRGLKLYPKAPELVLLPGKLMIQQEQYPQALAYYDSVEPHIKHNLTHYKLKARAAYAVGNYSEAKNQFLNYEENVAPLTAEELFLTAQAIERSFDFDEGHNQHCLYFLKAADLDTLTTAYQLKAAECALDSRLCSPALNYINNLPEGFLNTDTLILLKARALVCRGKPREALEIYDAYIEQHPTDDKGYRYRSIALLAIDKPKLALEDAQKAIELNKHHPYNRFARGIATGILNRNHRQTVNDILYYKLHSGVVERRHMTDTWYCLATGYNRLGISDSAHYYINEILRTAPGHEAALALKSKVGYSYFIDRNWLYLLLGGVIVLVAVIMGIRLATKR